MKKIIITLLTIIVVSLSASALTMDEYWNLKENPVPHRVFYLSEFKTLFPNENHTPWLLSMHDWAFPTKDQTHVKQDWAVGGLIENNFKDFYYLDEIGKLTPLQRESNKYKDRYLACKAHMDSLRDQIKTHGLISNVTTLGIWDDSYKSYDMEKKAFKFYFYDFVMRMIYDKSLGELNESSPEAKALCVYVPQDMQKYFETDSCEFLVPAKDSFTGWEYKKKVKKLVPITEISVQVSNLEAAVEIQENQLPELSESICQSCKPFDFFIKAKLVDEQDFPHLELEDIILVHNATREVVWSLLTGDHSNELSAFK